MNSDSVCRLFWSFANSGDPVQRLSYAASDQGLHCLPNTLLGVSRLQWDKVILPNHIFPGQN